LIVGVIGWYQYLDARMLVESMGACMQVSVVVLMLVF